MSDLRQAAQQALDALEFFKNTAICAADTETANEAITALRAALAEPQTTHWQGCEEVHPECRKSEPPCKTGASCTNKCPRCAEPEPRQWVSLTEQEMYDLFFNDQYGPRLPEYLVNTIKCVEAALKEKNNG